MKMRMPLLAPLALGAVAFALAERAALGGEPGETDKDAGGCW
jgi:hypothetical protein